MRLLFSLLFLGMTSFVFAQVQLPSVLSSGMVLQQQSNVKLWGWANSAEKIYVTTSWNNKTDSTTATRDANWQLFVQTPAAGGPYTITIKGSNTIVLDNVLIGEVWVCSGQSNMEWNYYNGVAGMKEELARAANKNIRLFHVPRKTAACPQEDVRAKWVESDSNAVKSFSAVAYFFGKKLNDDLNIPIGLINASWGGTPAEVWTPAAIVSGNDTLKKAAAGIAENPWWTITPGYAYNGMIAPLTNFAIAGAIWYQGESNTGAPNSYARLLSSMIEAWREKWNKELPFYFVQIAPFTYGNKNVGALVREQQTKVLALPKTGMAVVYDLVEDTTNIHPTNKLDVGNRLANLALAQTYGRTVDAVQSPLFQSAAKEGNKLLLSFAGAETGLMIKGKSAVALEVAGADRVFYPAEAKVNGSQLTVWSKKVKEPVAARYAFSNAAIGNLYSKNGLPVAPFRSDSWEVDTAAK